MNNVKFGLQLYGKTTLPFKVNEAGALWLRLRKYSTRGTASDSAKSKPSTTSTSVGNVPGLSDKVVKVPSGEVGPGASKAGKYKNPEYFCYNDMSWVDAEIEMAKYRVPQPSAKN